MRKEYIHFIGEYISSMNIFDNYVSLLVNILSINPGRFLFQSLEFRRCIMVCLAHFFSQLHKSANLCVFLVVEKEDSYMTNKQDICLKKVH